MILVKDITQWRPIQDMVLVRLMDDETVSEEGIWLGKGRLSKRGTHLLNEDLLGEVVSVGRTNKMGLKPTQRVYVEATTGQDVRINGVLYSLQPAFAIKAICQSQPE